MLQWMGGSRRKVTASRKSTQKRQKQYFEQRKRQQQLQTAGLESYTDGISINGKNDKEHRSLDVLSLLNLSTIAQEHKSSCFSGKENLELNASAVKYNIAKDPPTVLMNNLAPADSVEFKEARNSSNYQVETASPKKVPLSASDNHQNDFNGIGDKPDHWKTASEQKLSILDLLGDDGLNDNLERSPGHEAHVAFSVEGLGKVGTETPVHSPQQADRIFSYGSPTLKTARRPNSLKNLHCVLDDLELEVDAMMQDIKMPISVRSLEYSTGLMDSLRNPKQKLSAARDCMQFDDHNNEIKSSFGDRDIFCNIEDSHNDKWDARSSFLGDNFVDESEYDTSWKNWPCETWGTSANLFKYGEHGMSHCAFEACYPPKRRDNTKATDRFNISDTKHKAFDYADDFMTYSRARHTSVGRNFESRDVAYQSDWSYFTTEEIKDSLSMQSEESCSSSAVRCKKTNNSPSNSTAKQGRRRQGNAVHSAGNKNGMKNVFSRETKYNNRDDIQQENCARGSGKCQRMSNLSNPKQSYHSNFSFQENLGPMDSWPFGRGYTTYDRNSAFSPTAETKLASSGTNFWTEDPICAFPVPELNVGAKSTFDMSKHGDPFECSPSGSFISEKFAFGQPFSHMPSYNSPLSSKAGFGSAKQNLSLDTEFRPPDLSHVAGSDLSVQESVSLKKENESKFQTTHSIKHHLGKEDLSSENAEATETSSSKNNTSVSECMEAKDETPKLRESLKSTSFPDHTDETSSSVKIHRKKLYHNDADIALTCQNGCKDSEMEVASKERKTVTKGQNDCVDSSCQVMMLESYVLQLLCVQKVLKEATVKDAIKEL